MKLSEAQKAQLSMLLEVSSSPKPGNIDRKRSWDDLSFFHFLGSSVAAFPALKQAEKSDSIGKVFYKAVKETHFHGENTHFGALLLLIPLIKAAKETESEKKIEKEKIRDVVQNTTVDDSVFFYKSFNIIDVYVPSIENTDIDIPDVNIPNNISEVKKRNLTLYQIMEKSACIDGVAKEWTTGFKRSFNAVDYFEPELNLGDTISKTYIKLLSEKRDTFVQKKHGEKIAEEVRKKAKKVLYSEPQNGWKKRAEELDKELINRRINPGTTADILCSSIFLGLNNVLYIS